jgi:hypothetical protein
MNTMISEDYASVAVVDIDNSKKIAISTISVTNSEVTLSGGWLIDTSEIEKIENILSNKLIVDLSKNSALLSVFPSLKSQISTFKAFLADAKMESHNAIQTFNEYQQADLAKRKKIIVPTFFEWPPDVNLSQIGKTLTEYGLQETILGTEMEMQKVLSAARLLKFFIQKWQADEQIRSNRKYVTGDSAKITILPPSFSTLRAAHEN